jgi:sortase A
MRAHLVAVRSSAVEPTPAPGTVAVIAATPIAPSSTPAPERGPRFVVGTALCILGALVLSFVGYLGGVSRLVANHDQFVLYDKIRYELGHGTAPTVGPIANGAPVAVLSIPAMHLTHVVVVEGSDSRDLMAGPGHEPGTVLPGQVGKSVILGRRETFGAPFHRLNTMRVGDLIDVASGSGKLVYRVDETWRDNVAHLSPPVTTSRIYLVTSDPAWQPKRSLVVTAALVTGTPGTAPISSAVAGDDQPLSGDHGTALSLLLWSQLTVIGVITLLVGHGRVRRSVLWMGGLPFLIVVLLHIYPDLAALLPNTL